MCGIVGIAGRQQTSWLEKMSSIITYRGPDDSGVYRNSQGDVSMGMRRLSIIDLEGGKQPISNEDGSMWVIQNGEIYNSPELRCRLQEGGHTFATSHSDTECLVHLYEDFGVEMVQQLNGMFAFIIYDDRRRRLFGARDRFGIKPLHYAVNGETFAFASELKSLLTLPFVSREIDPQSLSNYLSLRYVPGGSSIFKNILRIPPGHFFTYDLETRSLTVTRYWAPSFEEKEHHTEDEWVRIIRGELLEAVKRWSLSDVPIGCSLSGGIDSTAIVGLLRESGYPNVRTYSLGFRDAGESQWDETVLARQMAQKWGVQHQEITLTPDDLLEDLIGMVWHLDEPYGGGLPSWYVFKFMSQDVKVGLTGTGGDELFGGYGKWRWYEEEQQRGKYHPRRLLRQAALMLPSTFLGADFRARLIDRNRSLLHPMRGYPLYFNDASKRGCMLVDQNWTDTSTWLQSIYGGSDASHPRDAWAYVDLQTQLAEEFLLMTDRFSMAHSLEARVPFLDHAFAEKMFRIPADIRIHRDNLKYLLKQAVADLLPADLLNAPKRGFTIPDTVWLRGKLRPLVEHLLAPERLASQGILSPDVYSRFVQPHLTGQLDLTGQVWTILMFQLWHMVFIEQSASEKPSWSWRDLS
jgi:asparagine synthase (glutamine-hydrolysing)